MKYKLIISLIFIILGFNHLFAGVTRNNVPMKDAFDGQWGESKDNYVLIISRYETYCINIDNEWADGKLKIIKKNNNLFHVRLDKYPDKKSYTEIIYILDSNKLSATAEISIFKNKKLISSKISNVFYMGYGLEDADPRINDFMTKLIDGIDKKDSITIKNLFTTDYENNYHNLNECITELINIENDFVKLLRQYKSIIEKGIIGKIIKVSNKNKKNIKHLDLKTNLEDDSIEISFDNNGFITRLSLKLINNYFMIYNFEIIYPDYS